MIRLFSPALIILFSIALSLFIFKSITTMVSVPFYDFDEAHRAENAKRMKEYKSYFVPLSGSGQDRVADLSISMQDNPLFRLYYHLERPFLVYLFMIGSTFIFGNSEFAYRFPSFVLGIVAIGSYLLFGFFMNKKPNVFSIALGLLGLITSADLWLSSQYAQLDTGLTAFLFLSLIMLLVYVEKKNKKYLSLSGIFFALAVLSKGQFGIIIIFPLLTLFILRKITLKDILIFGLSAGLLLVPWVVYLSYRFGFSTFLNVFFGFGFSSALVNIFHASPPFWYVRWWWESLRPGWTIFLALFLFDLPKWHFDSKKLTILAYIFGSLVFFSIQTNKIWWYVLPLVPAIALYIFLSASDLLKLEKNKIANISVVVIIASLPLLKNTTNLLGMLYGAGITIGSIIILIRTIRLSDKVAHVLFVSSIAISLVLFSISFPAIVPYYWETKDVAQAFKKIDGKKCLWVYQMPAEAALFYSETGNIFEFSKPHFKDKVHFPCTNYLMTPASLSDVEFSDFTEKKLIFKKGNLQLVQIKQML